MGRRYPSCPTNKLGLLRRHFLLQRLSEAELADLAEQATLQRFAAGQMIFAQGAAVADLMVVVAGRVKLSATSADGRELLLNIVERGHAFGEIALIDGQPRSFDAVAIEDSEVLTLARRSLAPFLARPEICAIFMQALCERLRRSEGLLQDAVFLGVGPRLARQLLHLAQSHRPAEDGAVVLQPAVSQQDLADLVGMTRESINKQLGAWRRDGIVAFRRGEMKILDLDRLQRIAGRDGVPPDPGPSPFPRSRSAAASAGAAGIAAREAPPNTRVGGSA